MKRIKVYVLISFVFSAFLVTAQKKSDTSPVSFPDSVRLALENTRKDDAVAASAAFATAWGSLRVDQQIAIQGQVWKMRKKKFPVRPHLVNYFNAIASAVNVEKADAAKISDFIRVAGLVIESESSAKALNFLKVSNTFFTHHALHYEKSSRLYARDDDYSFDYIAPAPTIDLNDTTSQLSSDETVVEENLTSTDSFDPLSDTTFVEPPLWMNPPPPPIIEGPVIRFSKVSLNFVTAYDSVFLKNTEGMISLRTNIFVGEEGRFDWSSAHLSADSVICNVVSYNFNVAKPEFRSDLVKLNYIGKTPGFVPGILEYKSVARKDSVPSTYPRFKSFQNTLQIQGIGDENVKYTGGFGLIGRKVTSASVSGALSTIEVSHQGQPKFIARSSDFQITDSTIISLKARINIIQGKDSITHPVVRMKYSFGDSTQRLLLKKDKGAMKHSPYSSTFFNVDFASDVIQWDLNSDSLNLLTDGGRNTVPLIIESIDFYDPEDFRLLKGQGFSFHPLALVANYCLKNNVKEFYSGDLAAFSGKEMRDIKAAIEFLNEKGLIVYYPNMDLVRVKDKALLIYKAYKGEMDYDNLKIHSVIDSFPNATLNFPEGYMIVRGVDEFKVSDSLNVRIKPDSSIITILQNRDIKFDGSITAGNFEISGKGFTLKYDSFFIKLTHIDSINFFVTETNSRGQSMRRKINNSMVSADSTAAAVGGLGDQSKSSGTLFISKSNNKSGKKRIPDFPRLDAAAGGAIYFDREEVLGGVYDRSMFFVVPAFKLDSLNNADPASINFEGTFVSSGMFPSFKEKLHTQPDKSLGFEHKIPATGYQLYEGDGRMKGNLTMNNRGLRGLGTINFLAASVTANDFVFYPDSVTAKGTDARLERKQFGEVTFPQATLTDFEMKWFPKKDEMRIKNVKAPFMFYDSSAQMQGTVIVSKNGVSGIGKLETRGTELVSKRLSFNGKDFGARRARFRVKSDDPTKPLLQGNDVKLKFDLEQNYADISPEVEGEAAIDFPFAQFKTSIPKMRWDLDEQKITMSKDPGVPLENSYFYSTRKELDSLNFNAEKAVYNLKTQELKVSGIPYIIVADAKITPENNEVLILENAKIGTLKNTTIVLDTLNGYHRLTEGVVDIVSRKEFSGYATYQYVNFLNDTFAIKMSDFHLEPIVAEEETKRSSRRKAPSASMQTVATGSVSDTENLVLGAGMFYKGDMIMYATRPALQLNGFVKLDIKRIKNYNSWITYSQTGDETDVLIDFNTATTEDGADVNAGLHVGSADNDLYFTFLNNKHSEDDEDFFQPNGMLYYDTASHEFKIEDIEKARGNKLSGKVFAYKDETMQVRFEGPVNLFKGSKDFNVTASAIGQGNMETNEVKMNSFLMVDSNIPIQAFDIMAKQIQDVIKNEGADEGLGDQTELLYKIADFLGERAVKEYEQKSLQGYVSLGTLMPLAKPLVFSNVNLKWSPKHKAFYSEGKLGMSNIGRNDINGAFEGFMEVKKTEDGGPVFNVFIKASPEAWFYFGLEDNRLLVQSSNSEFNSIITKKTNGGKAKIGEVAFIPGSDDETLSFINRFRKDYYDIDVPYDLNESAAPAVTPYAPGEEVQRIPQQTEQAPVQTPQVQEETPQDAPKKEEKRRRATQKKEKKTTEQAPVEEQPKKEAAEGDDEGF
ncbi:hypothetical protein [Chryseolinea sp. H1M3-3]|uniref:cell envelope integrity protein TolA n=1 Tax=Chryseolinea sp. H1M3-3 TaxID=3034144 RepID=UPI0023EB50CD|nr:hypothetical protein [Chryseolinea sp. H1M3-3]